jgi:hypothetical protein
MTMSLSAARRRIFAMKQRSYFLHLAETSIGAGVEFAPERLLRAVQFGAISGASGFSQAAMAAKCSISSRPLRTPVGQVVEFFRQIVAASFHVADTQLAAAVTEQGSNGGTNISFRAVPEGFGAGRDNDAFSGAIAGSR